MSVNESMENEEFKLFITVEKAKITRILESKQDPYVTLKLGDQTFSTKPQIDVATNPFFNETFMFDIIEVTELNVELYDYDDPQKSDLIGKGVCSVKGLKKKVEKAFEVQVSHRHKPAGTVFLKIKMDIPPKAEPPKKEEVKPETPKEKPKPKEEPQPKEEEPKPKEKPKPVARPLKKLKELQKIPQESLMFVNYFYQDPSLSKILHQGLLEVYRNQPKSPITFLGQYLLNYSESSSK